MLPGPVDKSTKEPAHDRSPVDLSSSDPCADTKFSRERYPENPIRRLWITCRALRDSWSVLMWPGSFALSVTELSQLLRFIDDRCLGCFVLLLLAVYGRSVFR